MKKLPWFLISMFVLVLDQITKYWALKMLHAYEGVSVMPCLNWTLMFNTGAAFSFLDSAGPWHIVLFEGFSLVMSLVIVFWIMRKNTTSSFELLALSLILGGAIGNLIDRLNHGYVIDFIDVFYKSYHWPAFNIADSAITLGGFVLLIGWAREKKTTVSPS